MKKNIKILALIAIVLVVIMIAAAAAMSGGTRNNNNDQDNTDTTPITPVTPVTPVIPVTPVTPVDTSPADIVLSGTGDTVTQSFTLSAGNAIYVMTHAGSANFIVYLKDQTGAMNELLANKIGTYGGSVLKGVTDDNIIGARPGTHYLDVKANGAWTVTVKQPRPTTAPSLPQTFTGTSDDAKAMTLTTGAVKFDMTYAGTSNFIVYVYDAAGNVEGLIANEIGDYSGSKSISVTTPGIHYLAVTGTGSWSVTVSHM